MTRRWQENIGTTELISQLAHSLRTKDKYFSFAGTKDRRARTLQRVAVSLIKPESLESTVGRYYHVVVLIFGFSCIGKGWEWIYYYLDLTTE